MCESIAEGGRRCPSYLLHELLPKRHQMNEYAKDIEDLKVAPEEEGEDERAQREYALGAIVSYHEAVKREVEDLQRKYNASIDGLKELDEKRNDISLTDAERAAAQADYNMALADVKARNEGRAEFYRKQESLRAELSRQGVDSETIDSIVKQAGKDRGTPYPRAYSHYEQKLKAQRKERKTIKEDHENRVDEILGQKLSEKDLKAALDKENARHKKADANVLKKLQDTRLALDSTEQGQQEMIDDTENKLSALDAKRDAAIYNDDYDEDARLGLEMQELWGKRAERLKRVRRLHKAQLSDRRAREELFKQIKAASKEVGGDQKAALAAFRKPTVKAKTFVDPEKKIFVNQVHLTDKDEAQVIANFEKSPEFKEHGADGFNAYANRRLMDSPLSRMGSKTLDELHAEAPIFDQSKPSRHKTSPDGIREVALAVSTTSADKEILRKRATSMHMSLSSYCRSMLIPKGNPLQIQNDRSKKHWAAKRKKVSGWLQESRETAQAA